MLGRARRRAPFLILLVAFMLLGWSTDSVLASEYTVNYAGTNLSWSSSEKVQLTLNKEGSSSRVNVRVVINGSEIKEAGLDPARSVVVDLGSPGDGRFGELGISVDERGGNDLPRRYDLVGPSEKGVLPHSFIQGGSTFRFLYPSDDVEDKSLLPALTLVPGQTYLDVRALFGSIRPSAIYLVVEGDDHDQCQCEVLLGSGQWETTTLLSTMDMRDMVWRDAEQGLVLYLYIIETEALGELQYLHVRKGNSSSTLKVYGIQFKDSTGKLIPVRIHRTLSLQFSVDFAPGETSKDIMLFWSRDRSFPAAQYPMNMSEFRSLAPATIQLTGDRDNDGLSDIESIAFGTDPSSGDSDGDGIPDAEEVYGQRYLFTLPIGSTRPYERDTDNDLLGDGFDIVPTIWYLPWFPVVVVLSCSGVVGARYLYLRIYRLRQKIREAYSPLRERAERLGENIELARKRCTGIDLELVVSRYTELQEKLEDYDSRLRGFSFRELNLILENLDEVERTLEEIEKSLYAKVEDYIARDLEVYQRDIAVLRDRGFQVPDEGKIEGMLPEEEDVKQLLDSYQEVAESLHDTIGNSIETAESILEALAASIDPGVQSPQLQLARREWDSGRSKDALADLVKSLQALEMEYGKEVSSVNRELSRSYESFLDHLRQTALESTDESVLDILGESIERTEALDSDIRSLKDPLTLPRAVEMADSLSEEASSLISSMDSKAKELEQTLSSSSPTAYQWQTDLELHSKVDSVLEYLEQEKILGEGIDKPLGMIKHLQECLENYVMRISVIRNYPRIEVLIDSTLKQSGKVEPRDLPVNHPEEFLKFYHARNVGTTDYERSSRTLRRKGQDKGG